MHLRFAPLALLALTSTAAAQISIDFGTTSSINSLGGRGAGQTFFPEDATGYAGQSTLELIELKLWTGNLGGPGHATSYIAVYDGDPDTGTLVGSSSNFVDTSSAAALPNYTELTWTFANLALNPSVEYWCVLSNSPMDVNPTNTVERSLQVYDPNASQYRGDSIIADRSRHQANYELRFIATFADAGTVGSNYCTAVANSTGVEGALSAMGSAFAATNDLTLTAAELPANQFGIFITSQTQGFVPSAGGTSNGNLCVVGSIGRLVGPGQILSSGPGGSFSLPLDLTALPQGAGTASVMAGETWNFQAWHRDSVGLGSNFTVGLEVLFQ